MAKCFNTTGPCFPDENYMVDLASRVNKVIELIENGKYFTINRARQFGKTTLLESINATLADSHVILYISFEGTDATFRSGEDFCKNLCTSFSKCYELNKDQSEYWEKRKECTSSMEELSIAISEFCEHQDKPTLLMIDEVDKNSGNEIFINFIGMLRNKYLQRKRSRKNSTFQSVILAGVHDIKNLKANFSTDEEKKYNSPWNIAVDFDISMHFTAQEIKTMLDEYETDTNTGMDTGTIAENIYKYTSGYPFLVSKICEIIDQKLDKEWEITGVMKAVKLIENDDECTLINSLIKNITNDSEVKRLLYSILLLNAKIDFNANAHAIKKCKLYSILKMDEEGYAMVHNQVFEHVLYGYFITETTLAEITKQDPKSIFIENGNLKMETVIKRFKHFMHQEYRKSDEKFIEKQGRLLFLCFLKPIINGKGFYYIEPQTRENSRMDIIVNYGNEGFVIELKLWRGDKYETEGKKQLSEYLTTRKLAKGYLITFSFLKNKIIQEEPEWIEYNVTNIYEAVI